MATHRLLDLFLPGVRQANLFFRGRTRGRLCYTLAVLLLPLLACAQVPDATQTPFSLPARVGDIIPAVELRDARSTSTVKITDFAGQVVFVDFWASYCLACQAPLQHSSDLMTTHSRDWAGKVHMVAVNMDSSPEAGLAFAERHGWSALRLLWSPMSSDGRENLSLQGFGVIELPLALLVDRKGTIVWRGSPNSIDLEQEILKLLSK